jgi:hypothetical protein
VTTQAEDWSSSPVSDRPSRQPASNCKPTWPRSHQPGPGRQRRWRIRAQDAAVTHMVSTVRAAEGPDDPLRNWLWSWETLVRARQRQAATVARRLHVPAPFRRPITQDIAVIADGNSLPSCRVPDALLTLG